MKPFVLTLACAWVLLGSANTLPAQEASRERSEPLQKLPESQRGRADQLEAIAERILRGLDAPSGSQPARFGLNRETRGNDIQERLHTIWNLRHSGLDDPGVIASLLEVLKDTNEPLAIRRAALNVLGHLPLTSEAAGAIDRLAGSSAERDLALSKSHTIMNGGFEATQDQQADLTGAFGETMFSPGSLRLTGWSIFEGPITLRTGLASPAGGKAVELGPRAKPGFVSQTIRTTPGQTYELSLSTCTGRDFAHFNRRLRIRIGTVEETVVCPAGSDYGPVELRFRAVSPWTTVSIGSAENAGFGPMIDQVKVEPIKTE